MQVGRIFSIVLASRSYTDGCEGPAWGTEVNEPGGRLFGEKIRQPGERRVPFDWELPYIGTLVVGAAMLFFGLPARPTTDANVRSYARLRHAIERDETLGLTTV